MILTDEFNILLFKKCATHSIIGMCKRAKQNLGSLQYNLHTDNSHPPASQIPLSNRKLPTAAVCRNAWDWYVSRYLFYENARINQIGAYHISDDRRNSSHLLEWSANCAFGESIDGFRKHLPYAVKKFSLGLEYFSFIQGAKNIQFIKFEDLENELLNFIESNCSEIYKEAYRKAIVGHPIENATPNRMRASSYYTEKEIQIVMESESKYIKKFKQEFSL